MGTFISKSKSNVDHIRQTVDLFPWEIAFRNFNIHDVIFLFNKTVKK